MRTIVLALSVALIVVSAAAAADTDRVQVGGSSSTRAFSPRTYVTVTTPDAYTKTGFDGDHGDWRGPRCVVSSNSSLSSDVVISWTVGFSNTYRTAEEAADLGRTFRDLPTVRRGTIEIPHRIRGRDVGEILAQFIIGQSTQEYGWAEIGLGIPLTRGVFAAARFWSTGPSFNCNVGTTPARQWHLDAAMAAAGRIVIDGNLPAARVTANPQRRRVAGFVSDGFGHPVVGVRVTLERKVGRSWRRAGSASTNASGFYSALSFPGLVRAAHGSLRSRAVRVR